MLGSEMFLKYIAAKTRSVYREEGARGVTRRVVPYTRHVLIHAWRRSPLRPAPKVTLVVLVDPTTDPEVIAEQLRQRIRRSAARETLIIRYGVGETAEVPARRLRRTRIYHVPESEVAIVANTAAALARGQVLLFSHGANPPQWLARLSKVARRTRFDAAWTADFETAPKDPAETLNGVALDGLALRRRSLIKVGMFRPEAETGFVTDALDRFWQGGYGLVALNEEGRTQRVWRSSRDGRRLRTPIRVIYLVNGTDVRGGIRIVFEHCNRLRDRGVETMVASFEEPLQTWFPGLRAPLISVADLVPTDVAVATFWTTAPHVARLKDCARYYFVQHDEALFHEEQWWKEDVRHTYRLPLKFITISNWLADLIRQESGQEALLVPNGINTEMFFPDPIHPEGERVRVLVEGNRNIFWKGLNEAAEALADLDLEVWSLGDTGIPSARAFSYPPQDQLRGIYSSCDILFKTSWYEGMPLPHMEAMACGCALVTTDVPGVRDYCVDGWNCLMTRPRDAADQREKLLRAVEDAELRAKLVENGLRTAEERFGWDDKIDLLAETYRRAGEAARAERKPRPVPR